LKKINKIEFQILSHNGGVIYSPEQVKWINDFLTSWDGEELTVTYEAIKTRTQAQNRFFHGCIMGATQRLLVNLGVPKASNYEYVKEVYLKKPYLTVNHGTPDEYVRPTSSLNAAEFWEFCKFCIELIVRLGGELNQKETEEYQKIVKQYNLEKVIDEAIK